MTTIDTSPEAIAALLDGVTPGPWMAEHGHVQQNGQLYWQVHDEHDAIMQNQFCWAQGDHAANARFIAASRELVPALAAEIARLERELAVAEKMAADANDSYSQQHDAMVEAEAEHDEARALLAMAYEAAAKISEDNAQEILDNCAPASAVNALKWVAKAIRALTPADANAALAARDAAMRNEGRRQAAEIARSDAQSETGPILRRRLAGNGTPVAASARRRQAIRTALRILAALEPEGGE